jgi:hypothetical protein
MSREGTEAGLREQRVVLIAAAAAVAEFVGSKHERRQNI